MERRIKNLVINHRYALFLFFYIVAYNFIVVSQCRPWRVSEVTFSYHLVDFSFGFRSNILPGAVFYGLFGEHATRLTATVYETVLILLFFAGVSFLLEKLFLCVKRTNRKGALVLLLFYLSGPFTFSMFTKELGMLDVYWLFFSLAFFVLLDKKVIRFIIPVLFMLSLAVHFSSVLNYLIMFSIILLYRASSEKSRREKIIYLIILFLSLIATILLLLLFLFKQAQNALVSIDDFHNEMKARGSDYFIYYDYAFFNVFDGKRIVSLSNSDRPYFFKILALIVDKSKYTFDYYRKDLIPTLLAFLFSILVLIVPASFFYSQISRFRKTIIRNRLKKLSILLTMIQFPFTIISGCLFSLDIFRWVTHAFLVSFTLFLFLIYNEESLRSSVFKSMEKVENSLPFFVLFLAYFSVYANPYG